MHLTAGTRLGVYEIRSLLGAGGMGEVYRARDSKLNRDVAIKILSGAYAADPERLSRFHREAQLLASLNHPYIAQIYGFEDFHSVGQPAVSALVLELVEGDSLAQRIAQGAVPLEEALPIARQVAAALAAAHDRGIIHRDLKPANIMLTPTGTAKVLDFGIAKALAVHPGSGEAGHSSTFVSPGFAPTTVGVVLGTVAYMSPEQARGKAVDKRSDIWAFGVVLYEMLAGERPFEGETVSDTVAAVLRGDVDWTRLPSDAPDELQRLLRRCLERDPENRLQDAGDVRLVLAELEREVPSVTGRRGSPARWAPWLLPALVALGAAAAGVILWPQLVTMSRGTAAVAGPIVRFTIDPPPGVGDISNIALAGDGRFAIYEGRVNGESRLFLRRLDTLDSRQLTGTEGARWPFVSPDGTWVGFFRDAKIYKVSTNGGDPLVVCDVRGGPGAAWTGDGRIVFSRTWLSGLSIVSEDGGQPTVLTTPDPAQQEIGHWWPSMLPDGHILFTVVTAGTGLNDARIALLDPEDGSYRVLFPGARASWMASGHLVFYRSGRYQAVPFDLSTLQVAGESYPVLEDAQELDPSGDWPQPVATAPGGALAYLAGPYVPPSRLTWIDPGGTRTALAFAERPFVSVKLSPDGRRAAAASLEGGRLLIRLFDLDRGTEEVLQLAGMNWNPVWLPDGRLSFTSMRKGDFDVYVKDVDRASPETALLSGPDDSDPVAWTHDGRLVFQGSEPDGAYPLKLLDDVREPTRARRLTEQHVENGGSLSPDDRWLAYHTAANGRPLIYVRPLAGNGPAIPLSPNTGEFPTFLRDGRQLAFVRGRQLIVQPWRDEAGRFETGAERTLTELSIGSGWTFGTPFDAAADGRLLAVVRTRDSPPSNLRVVLGWDREVSRLWSNAP